mgnify:CR=1 FL=1
MTREEVKRASRWTPVFGCSPPIILVNVLDPGNPAHTRENAAKDCSVSDGQAVCQADHVLLDTLVVRAGENTLERDTDYIAAHAKAGSGMEVKITPPLSRKPPGGRRAGGAGDHGRIGRDRRGQRAGGPGAGC